MIEKVSMASSIFGRAASVIASICLGLAASFFIAPAVAVAASPQACIDGVTGVPYGSVVLRGSYICAGVSAAGTLGVGGTTQPGIIYDAGGNVIANGNEYLAVGTPYDGFAVQANNISFQGNSNDYAYSITGSVVDQSSGALNKAAWSGGTSQYDITNVYSFNDNDQKIDVSVTITARVDIVNLRYMRSVDPDITTGYVDSFETTTGLGREHLGASDFVYSEIPGTGTIFAMYSDSAIPHKAGIYYSCCSLVTPDTFLSGVNAGAYGDYSIGIGFQIGDLLANQSVTLTYSYLFAVNLEQATEHVIPVIGTGESYTSDALSGGQVNPVFMGGTLRTVDNSPIGTNFAVNSAGGSIDTDGHDVNFSGGFTGAGQFTKTGQGTMVYSGSSTNTGGASVTGGSLVLTPAGSIAGNVDINGGSFVANGTVGGTVSVNSGTLYGSGAVGGLTVNAGGIVAPGNSPGTITVNGAYTLSAGGTMLVEVQSNGVADKIVVNGTVNLAGDLDIRTYGAGFTAAGYSYLIIDNDGGDAVTGSFASVGSNLVFLTATVNYLAGTGNDVELTLTHNGTQFASLATTPNQLAVAGGMDAAMPFGDDIFSALLSASASEAVTTYDNLSGEIYASLPLMLTNHFQSRIEDLGRDAMAGAGEDCGLDCAVERAFSIVATGGIEGLKENGNAAAADLWLGGLEARVVLPVTLSDGGEVLFGGSLAYEAGRLNIAARSSNADIQSGTLAGFVGYANGPLQIFGSLGGQIAGSEVTRNVALGAFAATGEADLLTASYGGALGISYALDFDGGFTVRPYAVLAHARTGEESFAETGLGAFSISGVTGAGSGTRLTVGMLASTEFDWGDYAVSPFGEIAVSQELGDTTGASANSAPGFGGTLNIGGASRAETTANGAFGISMTNSDGVSFDAAYSLAISSRELSHAGKVGLKVNF